MVANNMVFEVFMVVFFSAVAVWLTWTFTARSYESKMANYTKVINDFEVKSKDLQKKLASATQQVESVGNSPQKAAELEAKGKVLQDKYMRMVSLLTNLRERVQKDYAGHSVTAYIVGEIEKVLPSKDTIQKQQAAETKDTFNRIKSKIGGGSESKK